MPDRIVLTGFRATGKTSVGVKLADEIGFDCIDMDAALSDEMGSTIKEFVEQNGWPAFRQKEKELLARLAEKKGLVIATGGGAVLHKEEWNALRENSMVIWLQADAETIRQRLRQDVVTDAQRPSLTGAQSDAEVETLLQQREPLYREGSDMNIDTTILTPEEIVTAIVRQISSQHPDK